MTTQLRTLRLKRVSLCAEPANEGARVVLFKSKVPTVPEPYAQPSVENPEGAQAIIEDQQFRALAAYPTATSVDEALGFLWTVPDIGPALKQQYAAAVAVCRLEDVPVPKITLADATAKSEAFFKSEAGAVLYREFAKAASNGAGDEVAAIGAAFDACAAPVVSYLIDHGCSKAQAVDHAWRNMQETYASRVRLMNLTIAARKCYEKIPDITKAVAEARLRFQRLADAAQSLVKKSGNATPEDAIKALGEAAREL